MKNKFELTDKEHEMLLWVLMHYINTVSLNAEETTEVECLWSLFAYQEK